MPTIRDVARRAGVAPITVSRVINNTGYISDETRQRVEVAIAELHYLPNTLSRSLRFKKTNMIALVVSDITNPFWTTLTRGVEDASSEEDFNVILCNTDEKPEKQHNYVKLLLQRQTDGILLVPADNTTELVEMIQNQNVPVVIVDRPLPNTQVDVVHSDSTGGAYRLTQHLIEQGHRQIALLAGRQEIATSQERAAGYRQALVENKIPVDESLIYFGSYNQPSGYAMAMTVFNHHHPRPTALFAGNNFIALGILQAIYECGLRVPEDISIVSFDDLPYSLPQPFLTVVAQSPYQLGLQAARLLLSRITGYYNGAPREVVLPVELIVRDSCRKIE